MSVRKRVWTTKKGTSVAYLVDYTDGQGKRRFATFDRKKDADDYHATVKVDVRKGVHVAPSASITVREAGDRWISACEAAELEPTTIDAYRQHLRLHINPFLGNLRLSALTTAIVRDFQDKLRLGHPAPGEAKGARRSAAMVKKVTASLGALLADAHENNLVAQNVVRSLKHKRRRGKELALEKRKKQRLEVGVDIPTPQEIDKILEAAREIDKEAIRKAAQERNKKADPNRPERPTIEWYPFLLVAIRCGLRASELRGLKWSNIDFKKSELRVTQRADRSRRIGSPKSHHAQRTIPIPPKTLQALREWKLRCPKGELELVFPNKLGNGENYSNIVRRHIWPILIKAGVKRATSKGAVAKYSGLHAYRHFFASWCINRVADGGQELSIKLVQSFMGHSSVVMTADLYSHLFPRNDDSAKLAAAEGRFG